VLELVLPELVGLAAAAEAEADGAPEADVESSGGPAAAASPPDDLRAAADEHASHTLRLVEDGLTSRGSDGGFTTSPRRAAVLRWFSWRRNGFRAAPGALLLRKGAIWRELIIVPLPRVQSVSLHQGPLLRRLRLAAVHLHTVAGPITAQIGALDEADALAFFTGAARDGVEAARADRTHRWLAVASAAEPPASPGPAAAPAPAAPAPAAPAPAPALKFESDPAAGDDAAAENGLAASDPSRITPEESRVGSPTPVTPPDATPAPAPAPPRASAPAPAPPPAPAPARHREDDPR